MRRAALELRTTIHYPSSEKKSHSQARIWDVTTRHKIQTQYWKSLLLNPKTFNIRQKRNK
jgi:hypothetical protein